MQYWIILSLLILCCFSLAAQPEIENSQSNNPSRSPIQPILKAGIHQKNLTDKVPETNSRKSMVYNYDHTKQFSWHIGVFANIAQTANLSIITGAEYTRSRGGLVYTRNLVIPGFGTPISMTSIHDLSLNLSQLRFPTSVRYTILERIYIEAGTYMCLQLNTLKETNTSSAGENEIYTAGLFPGVAAGAGYLIDISPKAKVAFSFEAEHDLDELVEIFEGPTLHFYSFRLSAAYIWR